jgi:hypothetical protein
MPSSGGGPGAVTLEPGRPRTTRNREPLDLTAAATMYREMGMTFWLEKADAELGGVER